MAADLSGVDVGAVARDLEWRIVVSSGDATLTYGTSGRIDVRSVGGAGVEFEQPPDEEVLRCAETVEIEVQGRDRVTIDAAVFLNLESDLRAAAQEAADFASRGTRPVELLPTDTGELGAQVLAPIHEEHGRALSRALRTTRTPLNLARCVECAAALRDFFRIGRPIGTFTEDGPSA